MKVFTITEGLENLGALRTGGQGSVYKARRTGAMVTAVKLIPTPIYNESEEDKNYRNFLNEVEKLKKVNEVPNPNVVKILSSGITESGSFPFIEMEYIDGPDLEELLKPPHDKVFTIKEAIKVADQLACALSHCHDIGVRHGDIKSNNVKFNIHSGNYVLLDFGLAVMSDEQRRSSVRHAGAIEFMAPEQNEGRMLFQTDVYSYGVVLFELLTGQVPFPLNDSGETGRNQVMVHHMEAPVPDLLAIRGSNIPAHWSVEKRELEMQVPAWLVKLVYRCLKKNPDLRFANGTALHDEINRQSISGSTNAELQAENELLKQKLAEIERQPTPVIPTEDAVKLQPVINTSTKGGRIKPVLVWLSGLIIIVLLGLLVSANKASKRKDVQILALSDSLNARTTRLKATQLKLSALRNAEAARKTREAIRASLMADSIKHKIITNSPKTQPKKRKKFLGLF